MLFFIQGTADEFGGSADGVFSLIHGAEQSWFNLRIVRLHLRKNPSRGGESSYLFLSLNNPI